MTLAPSLLTQQMGQVWSSNKPDHLIESDDDDIQILDVKPATNSHSHPPPGAAGSYQRVNGSPLEGLSRGGDGQKRKMWSEDSMHDADLLPRKCVKTDDGRDRVSHTLAQSDRGPKLQSLLKASPTPQTQRKSILSKVPGQQIRPTFETAKIPSDAHSRSNVLHGTISKSQSILPTVRQSPGPSMGSRNMPFLLDDDSEDETPTPTPKSTNNTNQDPLSSSNFLDRPDAAQRRRQYLLHQKAREENARMGTAKIEEDLSSAGRWQASVEDDLTLAVVKEEITEDAKPQIVDSFELELPPKTQNATQALPTAYFPDTSIESISSPRITDAETSAPGWNADNTAILPPPPNQIRMPRVKTPETVKPTTQYSSNQGQSQDDVIQSQELANRREAAAKSRREADLRRDAQVRKQEDEKRLAEQRQWAEARSAQDAERERLKRSAEQAKNEAAVRAQGEEALAKLMQTKKAVKTAGPAMESSQEQQTFRDPRTDVQSVTKKREQPPANLGAQPISIPAKTLVNIQNAPDSAPEATKEQISKPKPKPSHPADKSGSGKEIDTARQRRIQEMEGRNARMRHVSKVEQEDEKNLETMAPPVCQPMPKGPVSLNSAAGQALLVQADTELHKPLPVTPGADRAPKRSHGRDLGEILPEDVRLLEWRDGGMKFSDITVVFERAFGRKRVPDTLRKRYKQVKDAVLAANIPQSLLDDVGLDHEEARRVLNKRVHGAWPLPGCSTVAERPRGLDGHFLPGRNSNAPTTAGINIDRPPCSSPNLSFDSRTLSGSPVPLSPPDDVQHEVRPHVSGKTMNADAYKHYLEALLGEHAEDLEESASERETSPVTDEDYCHFAYHVERREISKEQASLGEVIDDAEWVVCSNAFDNLSEAHTALTKHLYQVPKSMGGEVDPNEDNNLEMKNLENGLKLYTMTGTTGAVKQVRTSRFLRTYHDGTLPRSKEDWAPRTIYLIKLRVVTKSKDDLFDEVEEEINVERCADNVAYTMFEHANTEAIKLLVKETFRPTSGHLTQRKLETQQEEEKWLQTLEEQEEDLFSGCAPVPKEAKRKGESEHEGDEDAVNVVEVWVEEGQLAGARNLY